MDKIYPHASKTEHEGIVQYYITRVGLGDSLFNKTGEMSNEKAHHVGIVRAFTLSPKLLLLDKPFGMLDSLTRRELQEMLVEVWQCT